MSRYGLVRHRRWLLYGFEVGALGFLPVQLQLLVSGTWNRVSCCLFGHPALPAVAGRCTYCCGRLDGAKARP